MNTRKALVLLLSSDTINKLQLVGIFSAVLALVIQCSVMKEDAEIRRASLVNQYWQTIRDTQGKYALGNQGQINAVERLVKTKGIDLTGVNLSSMFLGDSRIEFANFPFSNLSNTIFSRAYLFRSQSIDKHGKNEQPFCTTSVGLGADLRFSSFNGTEFSEAVLLCGNFGMASGSGANFFQAKLEGASFFNSRTIFVNFSGADLTGSTFYGAQMLNATFVGSKLNRADFSGSVIQGSWFERANLSHAKFEYAKMHDVGFSPRFPRPTSEFRETTDLRNASFRHATLVNVDFRGADLTDADFTDAKLIGVKFDEHTKIRPDQLAHSCFLKEDLNLYEFHSYTSDVRREMFTNAPGRDRQWKQWKKTKPTRVASTLPSRLLHPSRECTVSDKEDSLDVGLAVELSLGFDWPFAMPEGDILRWSNMSKENEVE